MNSRLLSALLPSLFFIASISSVQAQLKLKLQLMPDGETYGIYVKSENWANPSPGTITASGQVTVVMPLSFQWGQFTQYHGNWTSNATVSSPPENPSFKYVSFGLVEDLPRITYSSSAETLLFSFKNLGSCPADLRLITCDEAGSPNDPFCFPNSTNTNPGNDLTVIDFQNGIPYYYFYSGVFAKKAWDCHDSDGDGIVNAHEDTNGNGVFDPGVDDSDLFNPNDPNGDGGLRLSLQLMPDGKSWGVFAKSAGTTAPTANTVTTEGQVRIVAPLGFQIDSITSQAGIWEQGATLNGPLENQSRSYLAFNLLADNPAIRYQADVPTLLFTIHRNGICPESLEIMDVDTDPLALACVPSQTNLCLFNVLNVVDQGTAPVSNYFYVGNYGLSAWSCQDNDGDGIPNALEDTNGDGVYTPGIDATDLGNGCDPHFPQSAVLTYQGATSTCQGETIPGAYLMVDVESAALRTYSVTISDGSGTFTINNYQVGQQIPVNAFGGAVYKMVSLTDALGCGVAPASLSGEIPITGEGPIMFFSQPTDRNVCDGTQTSFTAAAVLQGQGNLALAWQMSCDNGATWQNVTNGGSHNFSGASTGTLTVGLAGFGLNDCQFRLSARTQHCPATYSETAILKTEGPFAIVQQPADVVGCDGGEACFTVIAENFGAGQLTYRWQRFLPTSNDWVNVINNANTTGATTQTLCLDAVNAANGHSFRALVKTDVCSEIASDPASVVFEGPIAFVQQPADVVGCAGGDACFTVSAENLGAGQLSYRWQRFLPAANDWINMADNATTTGATTQTLCLDAGTATNGLTFRALVKTDLCSEVTSEPATVMLEGPLTAQLAPSDVTVEAFENATFSAYIANLGTGIVQYQWQRSTDGQNWENLSDGQSGANQITGALTPSLTLAPATGMDGHQFRLKGRTAFCGELVTPPAKLTVNNTRFLIVQDLTQPIYESCGGELVILTVKYDNSESVPAEMVWEVSNDGATWAPVENATPYFLINQPDFVVEDRFSAVLAIQATTAQNGLIFRCRLTSGLGTELQSASTKLNIAVPIEVAVQPKDATVCFNEGHTFTLSLSNGAGSAGFWTMTTDNGQTWVTIEELMPTGFGGVFENTASTALHITSVDGLDGAYFQFIAQSGSCVALSDIVKLSVHRSTECLPASHYVDYKLKLRPDGESWGVWIKAAEGFQPTGDNVATAGRIVIAASNGFAHTDLKSHAGGLWKPGKYKYNDEKTPGMSYYTFDLVPGNNVLNLQVDNEIMLFSFKKTGDCPADIYLADEYVPAGMEPNLFTGKDNGTFPVTLFTLNEVYDKAAAKCGSNGQHYAVNSNPGNTINGTAANSEKMTVFPNPATDWLNIILPEMEPNAQANFVITSSNGAVLEVINATPFQQKITIQDLPAGFYFLTLEINGKPMDRQKIIKR